MKILTQIWEYLDGKKTNIGAGIGVFIWLLSSFNGLLIETWHFAGIPKIDAINATLMWIAGLFGSTGLVHQYAKYKAASNDSNPSLDEATAQQEQLQKQTKQIVAYAQANNMTVADVSARVKTDATFATLVFQTATN